MDWITPRRFLYVSYIILQFFVLQAAAEVYIWVDEKGQKHFSDQKPAHQKSQVKKLATTRSEDHEAIARQNSMNAFVARQSKNKYEQAKQDSKSEKNDLKKEKGMSIREIPKKPQ